MTQPTRVPPQATDRIRPSSLLPPPQPWRLDRPADDVEQGPPEGVPGARRGFGSTGPDLGYGLKLARRLEPRLQLEAGEDSSDAIAGSFACGSRRAAALGRAPVMYDMDWAATLWGLLGGAPSDLCSSRVELFRGAAHDYWRQRRIADSVRAETLALSPDQVRERLSSWKEMLSL